MVLLVGEKFVLAVVFAVLSERTIYKKNVTVRGGDVSSVACSATFLESLSARKSVESSVLGGAGRSEEDRSDL